MFDHYQGTYMVSISNVNDNMKTPIQLLLLLDQPFIHTWMISKDERIFVCHPNTMFTIG